MRSGRSPSGCRAKLSREVIVPFPPSGSLWENVAFTVPQRGDKLRLLELSERNARLYRLEKLKQIEIKDPARHTNRILSTLQRELRLSVRPAIRMFRQLEPARNQPGGLLRRGFGDGKPSRKEYRHFNIKTVVGANDFASMEEVIGPPLQPAARRGRRASRADRRRRRARDSSDSPTKRCNGSDWNTK